MSRIVDLITSQIGDQVVDQLSERIGADRKTTASAVSAALPMLVAGLAREGTGSEQQARSLNQALESDHDGSLLDRLSGLAGAAGGASGLMNMLGGDGGTATDGQAILGHLLGNREEAVEKGVSEASGLSLAKAKDLLVMLAPLVMQALGKIKGDKGLDLGGLMDFLGQEKQSLDERAPTDEMRAGGLTDLLDSNDDGKVTDDVAKLGGMLGGLMGR